MARRRDREEVSDLEHLRRRLLALRHELTAAVDFVDFALARWPELVAKEKP